MYKQKKICAIIPAAGQGKRMQADVSKQYIEINGKPIIAYTLELFQNLDLIDHIILVVGDNEVEYAEKYIKNRYGFSKVNKIISGGADRRDSVYLGLKALEDDVDMVLIHDGVRPMTPVSLIEKIIKETNHYQACILAVPVKDTIKVVDEKGNVHKTPKRNQLYAVQTPQAFDKNLILRAYEKGIEEDFVVTDDAMMVEHYTHTKVRVVEGDYGNIKITTPEDFRIFKEFIIGQDKHK